MYSIEMLSIEMLAIITVIKAGADELLYVW